MLFTVSATLAASAEHVKPGAGNAVAALGSSLQQQATRPAPLASNGQPSVTQDSNQGTQIPAENHSTLAASGLFGGGMALLLLFAALTALALRTRFHLEFTLLVAAAALAHAAPPAVAELLSPGAGQWLHLPPLSGLALTGAFAAMATRSLLETRGASPKVDRTLIICAWLFMAATLLPLGIPAPTAIAVLAAIAMVFAVAGLVAELRSRQMGEPGTSLYLLALFSALMASAGAALAHQGTLTANAGATVAQLGTIAALLLLAASYNQRSLGLLQEHSASQTEALAASEHLVESLQESQRISAQFAVQRARELEAANNRLQQSEQRFQQFAHHDVLTGLANQLLLADRIGQCIVRSKRHKCRMAVVMVDLDNFGTINDTLGEAVGDELLKGVAARLRGIVREQDTVARPGTDEFIIVLEDVFDPEDVKRVSAVVNGEFSRPFAVGKHAIKITATVGCAIHPEDGIGAAALLTQAERAMGHAKMKKSPRTHTADGHRLDS
jgi:diguanylate cyclase (GGDEF)-like protein